MQSSVAYGRYVIPSKYINSYGYTGIIMSNGDEDAIDAALCKITMTRRRAISTVGKVGAAVVATAVIAGAGGYYAGASTANSAARQTLTNTVSGDASTVTVTASGSSTTPTMSSSTSPSTASYGSLPSYIATWQ